jgi:hypothetical protein
MTNFSVMSEALATLVAMTKKFPGFQIPADIKEKIRSSASSLEDGKEKEACQLVSQSIKALAGCLRGFIDNSPKHFEVEIKSLCRELDPDLASKAQKALVNYKKTIEAGQGWSESVRFYNGMGGVLALLRGEQKKRNQEKLLAARAAEAAKWQVKLEEVRQAGLRQQAEDAVVRQQVAGNLRALVA